MECGNGVNLIVHLQYAHSKTVQYFCIQNTNSKTIDAGVVDVDLGNEEQNKQKAKKIVIHIK